jgi:hypothetical protein
MEVIRIMFPRVGRGSRSFDRVYCFDIAQQDLLPRIFPGALVFPGRLLGGEIFAGVSDSYHATKTRSFKFERNDALTKTTGLELPAPELQERIQESLVVVPLLFGSIAGKPNLSKSKYSGNRRHTAKKLGHEGGLIMQGRVYTPVCCACKNGLLSITGDCIWDSRECIKQLVFDRPTTFAQAMRRYHAHVEENSVNTKARSDVGK